MQQTRCPQIAHQSLSDPACYPIGAPAADEQGFTNNGSELTPEHYRQCDMRAQNMQAAARQVQLGRCRQLHAPTWNQAPCALW